MVRYTNLPILFSSIRSDTSANFRADLDAILLAVGWSHTPITSGFVYGVTSPQGYTAELLVQDGTAYNPSFNYGGPWIAFQARSTGGAHAGYQHVIRVGVGGYTAGLRNVVADKCQLFLSTVGLAGQIYDSVAFGIPYVTIGDAPCTVGLIAPTVTEIWWSNGGSNDGVSFFGRGITDFRLGPNVYAGSDWNFNGTTTIWPDNTVTDPTAGMFCLFPFTPLETAANAEFEETTNPQQVVTFHYHTPIPTDALVGWQGQIKAQLYDAFLQSAAGTLDQITTQVDTDANGNPINLPCIAWHTSYYSTLQLIIRRPGTLPGLENVAY